MTSCISISWSRWKTQLTQLLNLHSLQVSIVSVAVVLLVLLVLWVPNPLLWLLHSKLTLEGLESMQNLFTNPRAWNRLYCKSYLGDMVYPFILIFPQKKCNFCGYLTVLDTPKSHCQWISYEYPIELTQSAIFGHIGVFFFIAEPFSRSARAAEPLVAGW